MTAAIDTANFHNEQSSSVTTGFTTATANTVSAADNLLLVWLECYTGSTSAQHATSVVWNAHGLTYYGQAYNTVAGTSLDLWYLKTPTAGSGTIVVVYPQNLGGFSYIAAIPISGANISGSISTTLGTLATTASITTSPGTVTPTGGNSTGFYLGCCQMSGSSITQTNANGTNLGNFQSGAQSTDWIPGSDTGSFSWTSPGVTAGEAAGVAVLGIASGGGGGLTGGSGLSAGGGLVGKSSKGLWSGNGGLST